MDSLAAIFSYDSAQPLSFLSDYFAVALLVFGFGYIAVRKRVTLRTIYVVLFSLFLYYKMSGLYLLLLCGVALSDYLIAQRVARRRERGVGARGWVALSAFINIAILTYFTASNFIAHTINDLYGSGTLDWEPVVKVVGVSFFVFQSLAYVIDVSRGTIAPLRRFDSYLFLLSFFPKLVCGPLVKAKEFIPQIESREVVVTKEDMGRAVTLIATGLFKFMLISQVIGTLFVGPAFAGTLGDGGLVALLAVYGFTMQLYCDFSGFSDFAVGMALMMGFRLPDNFDAPYKSATITEFWRRWHMSLGRWLKSYLYIPLGGNRRIGFGTFFWLTVIGIVCTALTGSWWVVGIMAVITLIIIIVSRYRPLQRKLLYSNLNSFITQVLGGLWHGASWNFTIWGGINGIGMIVNKFWREMGWHMRMACMALLTASLWIINHHYPLPVWLLFAVWASIVCAGTTIRYVYWLCTRCITIHRTWKKITDGIATAWAIAQTFTFITFTRLFFRSSSNLDPKTANEEAWETATNMIHQMGGAWNNAIIPEFLYEYRWVVAMFAMGMLIHWLPTRWKRRYRLYFAAMPLWLMVVIVMICIVIIYQFVTADTQPFIYFQF